MSAIAWRRGVKTEWVFCKREVAERNLAKKPEIEILFRATFPFIEW